MKARKLSILFVASVLISCSKKEPVVVGESNNPVLYRNTAFELYEDLKSPKFEALKEGFMIDTVFHGEQDEFKRQLILRNWIRSIVQIADFEPSYPGNGFPENILNEALKGQGYHCGHYMIVQNAVMNAYGYVTRCLGAGPGVKGGPDGHHGINEVWSNSFKKWYLSDAKYNHHFEKDGVPLSAIEIREEYLKNKAADVVLLKGPERKSVEFQLVADRNGEMKQVTKERFAQTYTWIEWEKHNDRATNWPDAKAKSSVQNMYEDEYFRNNTWIWDGKPHWAYDKPEHMIRVSDHHAIEWTPNVIASSVNVEDDVAHISLESDTPNLDTYQMKSLPYGEWKDVGASLHVTVSGDGDEYAFRTVNLAGVTGPEHRVALVRRANP